MTATELARLVAEMRTYQRAYFRCRTRSALDDSLAAERRVDRAVEEILSQPTLSFGDETR